MEKNNIIENLYSTTNLDKKVVKVLHELQSPNGMFDLYDTCLDRIEEMLFVGPENISISESDTLSYLRILRMLRKDLREISNPELPTPEEKAENI